MHTTDHGHPTFEEILAEMAGTRSTFESLRSNGGSFDERARLVSRLHDLRARAAELRTVL
jgi:hypothetical protein